MEVCICAESAVEFWRMWRLSGPAGLAEMGITPSQSFVRSWRSCTLAGMIPAFGVPSPQWTNRLVGPDAFRLSTPVDFLTMPGGRRSFADIATSKSYASRILPTDIVAINNYVHVTTPEFSLLGALQGCGRAESLRTVNEFCGTYVTDSGARRGFHTAMPITSRDSLVRFCDEHPAWRQTYLFRGTVNYAIDNCASPAESSTALLLCLPVHDGGYNLPLPEMNARIVPDAHSAKFADRNHYVGDAVWRNRMTIVEYDSKAEHRDQSAVSHDYVRKMALEAIGYHVNVVTPVILADPSLFEKVALDTARRVGARYRMRMSESEYRTKQREIRGILLSVPNAWHQAWPPLQLASGFPD